jgi:hypothetical protein
MMIMSMGLEYVSELQPQTGLLSIPGDILPWRTIVE